MISFTPSNEGEHRALANPKLVALTLQVLILIIKRLQIEKEKHFLRFQSSEGVPITYLHWFISRRSRSKSLTWSIPAIFSTHEMKLIGFQQSAF